MHYTGGSGEPMCGYNPHVMDEVYDGNLHGMQGEWTK